LLLLPVVELLQMRFLRKLIQKVFVLFTLALLSSALVPASAHAFMYRGGYYSTGFSGGALAPFQGLPFYPGGGGFQMTGQMGGYGGYGGGVDMMPLYVSNSLNWNGAQPMGFSYLPPMGLSAVGNSMMFNQYAPYIGQSFGGGAYGGYGGYSGYGSSRAF
jgi:hypothetical protein